MATERQCSAVTAKGGRCQIPIGLDRQSCDSEEHKKQQRGERDWICVSDLPSSTFQCLGLTHKAVRCQNRARTGSNTCWIPCHQNLGKLGSHYLRRNLTGDPQLATAQVATDSQPIESFSAVPGKESSCTSSAASDLTEICLRLLQRTRPSSEAARYVHWFLSSQQRPARNLTFTALYPSTSDYPTSASFVGIPSIRLLYCRALHALPQATAIQPCQKSPSEQYWSCNILGFHDRIIEAFFDPGRDTSIPASSLPSLMKLRAQTKSCPTARREVILVDRVADHEFRCFVVSLIRNIADVQVAVANTQQLG